MRPTKHLVKRHTGACGARSFTHYGCGCQWSVYYRGIEKVLSAWTGKPIDPRSKRDAIDALNRCKAAIDNGTYDPTGERLAVGSDQTLAAFIDEWITGYAEARGLAGVRRDATGKAVRTSLRCELDVIKASPLGALTLEQAATAEDRIAEWLTAKARARKWSSKTFNEYHGLLSTLFKQAQVWLTTDGQPRIARNPMLAITRKIYFRPDHFTKRFLDEEVERKLIAACDQLDRPQHKPNRNKLTQADADAIRARLVAGARGVDLARAYQISPAVVSAIKHGDIWNPAAITVGTKGKEMRRRVIGGFRMGARVGELQLIKLEHVDWRPIAWVAPDGTRDTAYAIPLPAELTKGGKLTGRVDPPLYAVGEAARILEARRFQLRANPAGTTPTTGRQFIFGTEDGRYQKGYRRLVKELFQLAGLDYGRNKGRVWHGIRHEFISRMVDDKVEETLRVQLARHRDAKTTALYSHPHDDRKLAAIFRRSGE